MGIAAPDSVARRGADRLFASGRIFGWGSEVLGVFAFSLARARVAHREGRRVQRRRTARSEENVALKGFADLIEEQQHTSA